MNPWEFIGWTAVILNELQRLDIKIGIPLGEFLWITGIIISSVKKYRTAVSFAPTSSRRI
jgi:hypothetical protein